MRYQVVIVQRPHTRRRLFGAPVAQQRARETLYGEAGSIEAASAILAMAPFYAEERIELRDTVAAVELQAEAVVVAWKGEEW